MREVSWRLNKDCNILTPPVPSSLAALLSRSAGLLNRGPWGYLALCWVLVLSTASYLQLIWISCRRGYIIIWHPPTSCERHICTQFNPLTVKVIPWYLRPDAPLMYTGAFLILTARPGANVWHFQLMTEHAFRIINCKQMHNNKKYIYIKRNG